MTGQNACLTLEMRVTWHVCAWYTYFEEIFLDLKNKTKNQRESIKYIEHIEHVYSDVLVECKWAIAGNICEHFYSKCSQIQI